MTGPLVAAIEQTWAAIQARHPDVPDVVLTLGNGSTRPGHLTLGHFHARKWASGDARLPELFVGGEGLAHGPRDLLGTLLHEAVHGVAATRGIQDTSRQGRYHNARYRELATEHGITVARDPRIGWSLTTVPDTTAEQYRGEIAQLGAALTAHRLADVPGGGRTSNNGLVATCECDPPRKIRLSRSTYDTGPIACGVCEADFTATDHTASPPTTHEGRARMTSDYHATDQHSVGAQVDLDAQLRWLTHLHDVGLPGEQPELWQRALASLRQRAEQAQAMLDAREREHEQVITAALDRLRNYRARMPEVHDEDAERGAAEDTAARAERDYAPERVDRSGEDRVLGEPVTEAHIDAAPSQDTRDLLIDTAAAQQAIDALRDSHRQTAHADGGLWDEYHRVHGHDETAAESAARLDTREGVQAVYSNARDDIDQRAQQRREHSAPTSSGDDRHPAREVDPHTTVHTDELDATPAGANERRAAARNQPDDLNRLRDRLLRDQETHRRPAADPEVHQHNALINSQAVHPRSAHSTSGQSAPTVQDDTTRAIEPDRGAGPFDRDHAERGGRDTGDAALARAQVAVELLTGRRRALDQQRHEQARSEQLNRWHRDDHTAGTTAAPARGDHQEGRHR